MPDLPESELLRKIKLERLIAQYTERGTQNEFAQILGISQPQMSNYLSEEGPLTERTYQRILKTLGAEDITLPEDYEKARVRMTLMKSKMHHGRILKAFQIKHNIKVKDIAQVLGVSSPAVIQYFRTEQFQPDVADKVRRLMADNNENFTLPLFSSINLPLISDTIRDLDDLSKCPIYQLTQQVDYKLEGAIVLKVETDFMEPTIRKGSELLGILVEQKKYKYHTGLTIVHYADMVAIGDVQSNDILDKGYITIQRGKGAVLRILEEDIQHLWHIALGLNVKF